MSTLTLTIPYNPHKGQTEFHQSNHRFRLLACGRRWGKTKSGANEFIRMITNAPTRSVGFCVAPTYWHTQKQWKEFLYYCPQELIVAVNKAEHLITLIGGRQVWFKSADSADSMRGEAVAVLWMDEGGQINEDRWTLELRPSLMDTHGRAIFTGTPKGKNWYFQLYTRGQDPAQTDYKSWSFSSYTNPYLDPKELDEFKRDMPELAYRQEILGEFLDDVGSVFRNVRENIVKKELKEEAPQVNKRYVVGCDLAKHEDFTVLCVLDDTGQLVHFDRFSQLDWVFQSKRINDVCQRFNNARLLIDSSGVGDPIYDQLRRMSVQVEGYKFTNASKKDLVENLSITIENKALATPEIPVLINELEIFGYKVSAAGVTSYGAPEGYHDDCVIALALATWQLNRPKAGISFLK